MPAKKWNKRRVVAAIRTRCRRGLSLTNVWQVDQSLYGAAKREFGSWRQAVLAAGYRYQQRTWNKHRVLNAIQDWHQQREMPGNIQKDDPGLRDAAVRYFGSWRNALLAAGFPVPIRSTWTKQRVVQELQQRFQQGLLMTASANRSLAAAAKRHCGGWNKALLAAGIVPQHRYTKWSRHRLLFEIQARRGVLSVSSRNEDRRLEYAARKYFGRWSLALLATGILAPHEQRRRKRKWSRQRVIAALQDRRVRGIPLSAPSPEGNLKSAARQYFGSVRAALLAAGLPVTPAVAPRRRWSRQTVIEEIQLRRKLGLSLKGIQRSDSRLARAAWQHFGGWHNALVAAGVKEAVT